MREFARAGITRRATAWLIDLFITVLPLVLISFLPGLAVPLDRSVGWTAVLSLPFMLVGFAYFFAGYAFLPNTYGRYVLGIRVVDEASGEQPTAAQALKRALTAGLWPIEAALIAFSKSKQRLGDRWADTLVVRYEPQPVWWRRAAPGAVGAAACYGLLILLTPWINARMDISGAAREYVQRELNAVPLGPPRQVVVLNDEGTVTMQLADGKNVRVYLLRTEVTWRAERAESIPESELGRGFSVQQGAASAFAAF